MGEESRICVVTGGRGFAARHLVLKLIHSCKWAQIRVADLAPSISLDHHEVGGPLDHALQFGQAAYFSADLRDKSQVIKAFDGASVVFHMAAPDSSINNFSLHYSVSVQGTQNVINACLECKVEKLIYTSSPSVVFDGIHGIHNGDESLPYPDKHNDIYSETKSQAEALVLQANGKQGLLTCAIRPSSIFGPGDKLMVPSVVSAARAGKSKFIIGDGKNQYDFTYVENVAHAHICAEEAMDSQKVGSEDDASGKAYFITNMEPIGFWEFMSILLEGLGYQRPKIQIPVKVIMPIACMVEGIYKQLGPYGMSVPQLTPSRVRLLSCSRTFNCSRAEKLIGYRPVVSLKEGIQRTLEAYPHLRADVPIVKSRSFDQPSKAFKILRNEKVAHVLLWRDEKQTVATMLAIFAVMFFYFKSNYTFISTMAILLILIIVALFFYGFLPSSMFGYTIKKLPPSLFQVSDETVQSITHTAAFAWNHVVAILKTVSHGKDWMLFIKTMAILLILKFFGTYSLQALVSAGLVFMFTAFYIYEQKEEEIDGALKSGLLILYQLKEAGMSKISGKGYSQKM